MNFRLTAGLIGVVLVLGLVLLGLSIWDEDKAAPDTLFPELKALRAEQIDAVEFEKADGSKLKVARVANTKDKWEVVEPIKARADSAAVSAAVNVFFRAKPIAYSGLQSNPAMHGLEPPGLKVTVRGGDKTATLNVGTITLGGSGVAFVTTSTQKRPMALSRSDVDALLKGSGDGDPAKLAKWTSDYRNKQVFAAGGMAGGDDVTAIKLTLPNKGNKELALTKVTTGSGGWTFAAPAGWGDADITGDPAVPLSGVRPLLGSITNLQATAADDFIENPAGMAEYGLDGNPDLIRVELKNKDGGTDVVFIGKKADAAPVLPGTPPAASGKVYLRVEGEAGVIKATGASLDGLVALIDNPVALRDRTLFDQPKTKVAGIDIVVGGQVTKLRQSGFAWQLFGGPGDPQNANAQLVGTLLDLLSERRTVKDFPAPNDANFAGAELKAEVKLWTEGTEPPDAKADPKAEPKLKGIPYTFQFGKKDASGVFVRRILPNGVKADFILPEKLKVPAGALTDTDVLGSVVKTRLDFLDPSLKKFDQVLVNRLTIQNGPAVTEVVKDKTPDLPYFPGGKWKYTQPAPQKDRVADEGTVSDLLNLLATQSASRFIVETPNDTDLAKWGLAGAAPRLKATVGLEVTPPPAGLPAPPDADKERIYYLGNETDDHNSVYARQEGRAAVFLVPKFVFERLTTTDLRDKTVVRFDVAKVKAVQIKGWKKSAGVPTEVRFEKGPTGWAAKTPPGYAVDPLKLEKFLGTLNGLRAKAFLPGPPPPNANLIAGQDGMEVSVEIEGGPNVALFIGGETDGTNSYFAQSSTLPANENVFTVQSDLLKPYTEKSGAFAK